MESDQNDIRRVIFKYRSYAPIPFLVLMLIFARPTLTSLIVGFCIVALGEGIRFWGVSIAGSETRTTGNVGGTYLITNGPFAFVRNPLYVGNMLLYAGVGVMSMALFPWMLIAAIVWFYVQYHLIVTREEEYLAATFGDAYEHYRKNVGRFIPRPTKYVSPTPPSKSVSVGVGLASEKRTLQAIGIVTTLLIVMYFIQQTPG
ncbi:MAG: methyltransferase family protein [Bacteroidota bacterium]